MKTLLLFAVVCTIGAVVGLIDWLNSSEPVTGMIRFIFGGSAAALTLGVYLMLRRKSKKRPDPWDWMNLNNK